MDVEERGGGVGIGRRLLFDAGETVLGRCGCTFPVITNRQLESTENISLPIVRALRILSGTRYSNTKSIDCFSGKNESRKCQHKFIL